MTSEENTSKEFRFKFIKVPIYLLFAIPHLLIFVGIGLFGFLLLAAGVIFLIWQTYQYLDTGVWLPISTISVLKYLKFEWALSPRSMFGLYDIFKTAGISLTLIAGSVLCFLFLVIFGNLLGLLLPYRKEVQPWINNWGS